MLPSLVINISKSKQFSFPLDKNTEILDLSNTLNINNKILPTDFFDASIVYPKALDYYKEFISKIVETPNLLHVKINQLPIFWITPLSIKHPIYHWGKDFFLLQSILEHCKDKIENNYNSLVIVIPNEITLFNPSIAKYLNSKKYTLTYSIYVEDTTNKTTLKTILKTFWWQIKNLNKYHPKSTACSTNAIYLIGTLKKEHQVQSSFIELKKLFNENNKSISMVPIFEWLQNDSISNVPDDFINAKPSKIQLLKLFLDYISAYLKILVLPSTTLTVNNLELPTKFLKNELRLTLSKNSRYFFANLWLKNYFNNIETSKNIFFDDEFYEFGRTVSDAAKTNSKIKTFGLQHGNFNEIHTVYTINDTEIKYNIPIPTHFITWGEIYNQLFLMNNSLPKNYTLALGNPKYINQKNKTVIPNQIKNILWCLTTKECFNTEWEIINHSGILDKKNLSIRLHPLKHINEDDLEKKITSIKYKISNEFSIEEAITNNDLIITSAHSTVFIDALVTHKYCIRLTSRLWNGNTNFDSETLKTVTNSLEMAEALSSFLNIDNYSSNELNNIITNKKYWENV